MEGNAAQVVACDTRVNTRAKDLALIDLVLRLIGYTLRIQCRNASVQAFQADVSRGNQNAVIHIPVYGHRAGV